MDLPASASLGRRHAGDATGSPTVLHRTLATNRGGAGGFHDGLGWAIDRGADLVWLMDDDGLPEPDCLATLLDAHRPRLLGAGRGRRGRPDPAGLPDPAAGQRRRWCTGSTLSRRRRPTA